MQFFEHKPQIKTLWFDMDGVLTIYDKAAFAEISKDHRPHFSDEIDQRKELKRYETVGSNFFLASKPDDKMIDVFVEMLFREHFEHIGIISTVSNGSQIYTEHVNDKKFWLRTHIENKIEAKYDSLSKKEQAKFQKPVFLPSTQLKGETAELFLGRKLNKGDVLIDDYNNNLQMWNTMGGTAIKYGNNINNVNSHKGLVINPDAAADEIVKFLEVL